MKHHSLTDRTEVESRSPVFSYFQLAVEIWLIGPLLLILTNAAFMKPHRVFVALYALGWPEFRPLGSR